MEEYTNRELGIMIENLTKTVEDGFRGVHERQDKTNGNVIDNKKRIEKNTDWRNRMIGAIVITNVLIVPLMFLIIRHFIG